MTYGLGYGLDWPPAPVEVGRRLALEARRVAYGRDVPRAPEPVGVRVVGAGLQVDYPAGVGLTTYGSDRVVGLQLCDAAGACRWAEGRVEGDGLWLAEVAPEAVRVRFCWADSPVCNLDGGEGLPAAPFELDIRR